MSLTAPACNCDSALRGIFGETWRCPVHGTRETRDELERLRDLLERYRTSLRLDKPASLLDEVKWILGDYAAKEDASPHPRLDGIRKDVGRALETFRGRRE